jgi:hypothetical protein
VNISKSRDGTTLIQAVMEIVKGFFVGEYRPPSSNR